MFFNGAEDRSLSTIIDGDIESKRSLLTKLYHAAYCQHEGYTEATKCPVDPLCCASKRLFEHMSTCTDMSCGIPCCKSCRRVWRHYRKCRHPSACPMCSVVPSAYTSIGLAPRFTKVVLATNTSIMSDRSIASGMTNLSMDSSINNTSFGSTAAVVVPAPRKKNGFQPPTFGKENATVVSDTSSANSGWIPMMDESRDQPQLDSSYQSSGGSSSRMDDNKLTMTAEATTTAAAEATTITPTRTASTTAVPTATTPKGSAAPSIPTPTTKKIGTPQSYPPPRKMDPPKDALPSTMMMAMPTTTTTSSSKPPLSPRRPQWALF